MVSDPQRPHGLQPSRLLRPWDFPGKNTGVGCHCLLRPKSIDESQIIILSERGKTTKSIFYLYQILENLIHSDIQPAGSCLDGGRMVEEVGWFDCKECEETCRGNRCVYFLDCVDSFMSA